MIDMIMVGVCIVGFVVALAALIIFLMNDRVEGITFALPAVMLVLILMNMGTVYGVGDTQFELSNDVKYVCPNCSWNGTTSDMVERSIGDGDYRYYYCTECGSIMGRQDIADPIPLEVMTRTTISI